MTTLSIVIVTYNPGELVLKCLDRLIASAESDWEIITVDNNSQDGMVEIIKDKFPQVNVISNIDNRGFAAANNIGLGQATGRYLALMNPDVLVEPNTFYEMLKYLDKHPAVGIVGPRTFTSTGKVDLSVHAPLTVASILFQFWGFDRLFPYSVMGRYLKQAETVVEPFEVAWLQGHCLVFRRAVYDHIGGLDEGLFLYNEEPDFCDRASKRGWKTVYVPTSTVIHLGSTTISRYSYVKMLHTHISMLYYFRKRGQTAAVRALKVGFVIELLVKWGICMVQRGIKPQSVSADKVKAYPKVIGEVMGY